MKNLSTSTLTKHQIKTFKKSYTENGNKYNMVVTIRYDDRCGNGHNSFGITADISEDGREYMGGCCHDEIIKHFPELEPFIKWHLTSSDGPMYYVDNTLHHARNTDYNGLVKGEYSASTVKVICDTNKGESPSIVYTSGSIYLNKQNNENLEKSNKKEQSKIDAVLNKIKPELNPRLVKEGCKWSISEGKEIDLTAARSCAVWPTANLEDFTKEKLEARLPALMDEFKHDVESLGFTY